MDIAKTSTKSETDGVRGRQWRNFVGFWILGLCNNYGYVVMLSAAHDILKERFPSETHLPPGNVTIEDELNTHSRGCNELSTGAILLVDIIPCLIVKFTVPFLPFYVHSRVALCVVAQLLGFLAVSYGNTPWLTMLGVALTSLSSGLGEVTIVSHSSKYGRGTIAAWASGTGGAGIVGAFSYAGLRQILSIEQTLLVMIVVPVAEAIAFWFILEHPSEKPIIKYGINSQEEIIPIPKRSIGGKLKLFPGLLPYIIPLALVYLFEYFINQGLHELIKFDDIWLSHAEQYRWLQVDYQIGVFVSRSSATFITFKMVWLMALLQFINMIVFTTEALWFYMPNIWIIFALTFWEGLLGGGAYVNTFYNMADTIPAEKLKDSLGIVTMSDSAGITVAGFLAMPVHNAICKLPRPIR